MLPELKTRMMEEHNNGIVTTRIWKTSNLIRGLDLTEVQMQQVIIAFTFLRRIDCLISQYAKESELFYSKNREKLSDERLDKELRLLSGGYPFYNYSGYTFSNILHTNNSLEVVINSYLQGFSNNIQEILDGMNFKQNVAILLRHSKYLVNLFDSYSEIDMSNTSIDTEEYVELISSFFSDRTYLFSQFFTSQNLSNLICECLLTKDFRSSKDEDLTIYDPVCGTGTMLANAGEKAKRFAIHQANIALYGQEISEFPCAVAKALALLTGNEDSKVCYGNTLTDDLFPNRHFQYIMADMPFGLQWRPIKERIERESFGIDGRFTIGLPNTGDSQFLFIQHIISKMNPHGSKAAFITSGNVLWGGDVRSGESRIRRWMFEHDMVEAIIALPGGVLPYTSIPIYLWILNNAKSNLQKDRVQLINGTFKTGKSLDVVRIVNAYQNPSDEDKISKIVMNDEFGFYELKLKEDGIRDRVITIDLKTNIYDYIEEEVAPFAKGNVSVDYRSVEKGYSVNLDKFFKIEDETGPSINDLSQKVLSLIEEFRNIETDLFISNCQEKTIAKEDTLQYGKAKLDACPFYPLHYIAKISKGQIKQPDGELPYITVSYLRDKSQQSGVHIMQPSNNDKVVTDSDVLLINTGANAGEIFKGVSGIASSTLSIIRANENVVSSKYLYYLLKSNEKYLRTITKGSSIKYIDTRMLSNAKFQLPSPKKQKLIVDYLDYAIEKIDKIIDLLGGTDNILTQYRQALIENVVHGKIKI